MQFTETKLRFIRFSTSLLLFFVTLWLMDGFTPPSQQIMMSLGALYAFYVVDFGIIHLHEMPLIYTGGLFFALVTGRAMFLGAGGTQQELFIAFIAGFGFNVIKHGGMWLIQLARVLSRSVFLK